MRRPSGEPQRTLESCTIDVPGKKALKKERKIFDKELESRLGRLQLGYAMMSRWYKVVDLWSKGRIIDFQTFVGDTLFSHDVLR